MLFSISSKLSKIVRASSLYYCDEAEKKKHDAENSKILSKNFVLRPQTHYLLPSTLFKLCLNKPRKDQQKHTSREGLF